METENSFWDHFSFVRMYDRESLLYKLSKVERAVAKQSSSEHSYRRLLYDALDMTDLKGQYEKGEAPNYYRELIKRFPSSEDYTNQVLCELYRLSRGFAKPEDYMRSIVDKNCNPSDGWENDTLRLRILKQFIKYGDGLTYQKSVTVDGTVKRKTVTIKPYNGVGYLKKYLHKKLNQKISSIEAVKEHIQDIEDDVFDVLKGATDDEMKNYILLKTADELSKGVFRIGGRMKRSLYLFAMVYGMRFFGLTEPPSEGGETSLSAESVTRRSDPGRKDIELQLFINYYNNNLLRFLTEEYQADSEGQRHQLDMNPSGQGINVNNYAEVVYLYYLNRDLPPQEKIQRAEELIAALPELQRQRLAFSQQKLPEEQGTAFYRGLFGFHSLRARKTALELPEEQFTDFLCDNYVCEKSRGSDTMLLGTEQRSAQKQYRDILDQFSELWNKQYAKIERAEGSQAMYLHNGLMFLSNRMGVEERREKLLERLKKGLTEEEKQSLNDSVDEFIKLLVETDRYLQLQVTVKNDKAVPLKTVTRTNLVAAYHALYNLLQEGANRQNWRSFGELFDDFSLCIEPYLQNAYYQLLDGRNLLDVLVVFSSFCNLHDLVGII